jgi:probable rRNA maturation factor
VSPDPFAGPEGESEGLQIEVEHPTRSLDVERLADTLRQAAEAEGFALRYLGVVLSDTEAVRDLHRTYFGLDTPTDVVTFPLDEDALAERVVDGEVYVDLDTAAERAPEFGASFEQEATRYSLHGLLHLMGYDDGTDEARATMRRLEDRYLKAS